jgi:hypothetical protein
MIQGNMPCSNGLPRPRTGGLLVDPYNGFLSEDGKDPSLRLPETEPLRKRKAPPKRG